MRWSRGWPPKRRTQTPPQRPNQAPAKTPPAAKAQPQPQPAQADPAVLMRRMLELFTAGKYDEAIPVSKQLIAAFDQMGMREHPMQASNHAALANLYRFTGDFAESERSQQRALAIREKAFGGEHPEIATSLDDLHQLASSQGRYADAERLLARALAMREKLLPGDHQDLAMTRISVARLHALQGRHDQAEPLIRNALEIFRLKLGPEHPYVGVAVNNLADALSALGRYGEAETLLKTAVELTEKATGPASPLAATALSNLSEVYRHQGRLAEAEELRRREIAILEASAGPDNPGIARSLSNFGTLLSAQRRPKEAEALLRRALAIQEKHYSPDHPDILVSRNNLAQAIGAQPGRREESTQLYRRLLADRERVLGASHKSVAISLDNLSVSLIEQEKFSEAEPLSRRALAINEAAYSPGHPFVALSLSNLAALLDSLGRHGETKAMHERALQIRRDALGEDHPDVVISLLNFGSNALDRGDWTLAQDTLSKATALWERRQAVLAPRLQTSEKQSTGDLEIVRAAYLGAAVAAERMRHGGDEQRLMAAAFDAVQQSSATVAAGALARAGARAAVRDPRLAGIVRERQDVAEQYAARDLLLLAELGKVKAERSQARIDQLQASMATLTARSSALDITLAREFPEYAAFATPKSLTLRETQALLSADEALVMIAPTRFGTLIWAVTRDTVKWVRADLTGKEINAKVSALRCGLDIARWAEGAPDCLAHNNQAPERDLLPFDTALAHELYRALIGPVEDVIGNRHILLSGADALTTLPFHVLVTEPPPQGATIAERLKGVAWLGQRQPLTTLASVASLKSQRQRLGDRAPKPFVAFANPLLVGDLGTDRRAFDRQSCPKGIVTAQAQIAMRSAPKTRAARRAFDVEDLRSAAPLPETTDEVCAVAAALGAPETDIYLGERATVRTIKQLAQRNALAEFRVVHFASHGLVAGGRSALEQALTEPAILLTPPPKGTTGRALEEDDGLLKASDVAALKLNADWVVLSACNTAAGSGTHAEPLAGLARAFFHAGARALLVSHWEVDSDAAVNLVTRAFAEMVRDPKTTRGRALQVAMTELAGSADPRVSHPAHWAPFVVVGDGR